VKRQAPRRRKGLRALIEEAALDQRIRDELFQVLRGAPLHARGDFFGEEFEEKIGHGRSVRRNVEHLPEADILIVWIADAEFEHAIGLGAKLVIDGGAAPTQSS
jgi:hypothetical protein